MYQLNVPAQENSKHLLVMIHHELDVDYRQAEHNLESWLKRRGLKISSCHEWNRWTYGARPFWSVWGFIYGGKDYFGQEYGIHVHDDGEVLIICPPPSFEVKETA